MKVHIILKKMERFLLIISIITVGAVLLSCSKSKNSNDKKAESSKVSQYKNPLVQNVMATTTESPATAAKAIELAQTRQQYLFLMFYDKQDDSYQQMEETITNFQRRSSEAIQFYKALTTDLKEADIVKRYGISRAPLPVVLAFAPNGAVTGGFPQKISNEQLEKYIVPELIMNILKSVQANKVALVVLKNSNTKFNNEVTAAANDFSKDERLNGFVDIIQQNPKQSEINDFLNQCKLDNNITEAAVVLIVPPGKIGGVYSGKMTKETLIAGLASCSGGGCASGRGPR
jgi:hypothetical protein